MRNIIIAGNWKMNKDLNEVEKFCSALALHASTHSEERVWLIVAPAFPFLKLSSQLLEGQPVGIAAQDVSAYPNGAYTGEVSAPMLRSLGLEYCIIGHSERRQYHCETNQSVRDKQLILRKNDIIPILCIGETLEQRDNGQTESVLLEQLDGCFEGVELSRGDELILAYEPVWAIGTGRTASPQQAQEAHAMIRAWFRQKYGETVAQNIHILYGGSVKPDNIGELLSQPDLDGGLIGGASLQLDSWEAMVETAVKIMETRI